MEKNKQVLEFTDIIGGTSDYKIMKSMFLDYIEYTGMSWEECINTKTKNEIIADFNHFNLYYYLPF